MFWGSEPPRPFVLFGPAHLSALALVAGIVAAVWIFRRRLRAWRGEKMLRAAIAALILIQSAVYQAWLITNRTWTLRTSLPFSICECAAFLCACMLLAKSKRAFDVAFFIGTLISALVILTPALDFTFPHVRFIEFFMEHGLIVISPLYMLSVHGFRPTQKAIWKTMLFLNLGAPFVALLNHVTGGNYWFIANVPEQTTLLSILGPWPWYILTAQLLGVAVFYLSLLPFWIVRRVRAGRTL